MRRMRALRALCPCVCPPSRAASPEDRGRAAGTVPEAVDTFVAIGTSRLKQLQDREGGRVDTYRELERVLQGQDGCLPSGVVNRLIAEASGDLRAAQGVMDDVRMAASDFLVALARSHFYFVMAELQSHLKVAGKVPDEVVLVTLGKMASSYAPRCVPFAGATLPALRRTLSRAGSSRTLRAVCGVLERWSKGITMYLCSRKQRPFPRSRAAQLCGDIYPLFHHAVVNWLGCKEEEDNRAVLRAVAAMVGVLVCEERHCQRAREQLLRLLRRHQRVQDTSRVTKNLGHVLQMLQGGQTPSPRGSALTTRPAGHRQVPDVTEEPGPARKAKPSRHMMLQAQTCPAAVLRSQLRHRSEAQRVATLSVLGELARSDAPAARKKLPQVVVAVQLVRNDPSAQVQRAVLEFTRELLSYGSQSCWPQDVVGHIFSEYSRSSGRLAAGGLFAWQPQEHRALRAPCVDILGSLDVSQRGMSQLLWPRLLQHIVPAQYSGVLISLSCSLRALLERRERAGCEEEEEPDAVDLQEQARLPAPQALLARLLVLLAAPHTSSGRAVTALQPLQAPQGWTHGALGTAWATEFPLLPQHLAGRAESSLNSAELEQHVLKFLRASLEPVEDETWTVGLSQQLSWQLGSSAPGSWEELFLYKALGRALAGCRDLSHVQGQVLRFLQDTDSVDLSETQGMISVVSHVAETHFNLVLDTVTAFTRDGFDETSTGWKAQPPQGTERPWATRAALMCTYSGTALRTPREQLLACMDREIMGTILRLSRVTQREMQLKLTLVQSVTEVSSAIQAVGDAGSFELSLKQEVTQTLLDWIKEEPGDSLVYGVFQALEELSKLRPALSREENRDLLAVCCQAVLSFPSEEGMKRGRTVRAALNMQLLHRRSVEDLGHLIETLLAAEETSAGFDDVVLVLQHWLGSDRAWERERALRVCARVLGACKERAELTRGRPCRQLGSLVGLLVSLTTDCLDSSRYRAWLCISYLSQMQVSRYSSWAPSTSAGSA
ncbi:maestro heat-like repeat-containing protein family member 2B isoform X1 [Caloenas nicobarica]|uniref:maestro heat-like repeat-containing protein family member 2B isoform X1 n=2 Tax=Caloenas nicobarica TaxID=187106 RepID=UPI0032B74944